MFFGGAAPKKIGPTVEKNSGYDPGSNTFSCLGPFACICLIILCIADGNSTAASTFHGTF